MEARKANRQKRLEAVGSRARRSNYLLSGGLFRCGRCAANMIGFHTQSGYYYVCGSMPYRKGMGCGPSVYVQQKQVEAEVLSGLRSVLSLCADPRGFAAKVNLELRKLWEDSTGFRPDAVARLAAIDNKIANICQAVEDGMGDGKWARNRLEELGKERAAISAVASQAGVPPQLDIDAVAEYRRNTEKVFRQGQPGERKRLLRNWAQSVDLMPETLEVGIWSASRNPL
jgi:hypothetical protein